MTPTAIPTDTADVVFLFQLQYLLKHGKRISYADALYLRTVGNGGSGV